MGDDYIVMVLVYCYPILSSIIFTEIMEYVSPWYINEESQQTMMNVAKMAAAVSFLDPIIELLLISFFYLITE